MKPFERREFLYTSSAVGLAGLTGCLSSLDDRRLDSRPEQGTASSAGASLFAVVPEKAWSFWTEDEVWSDPVVAGDNLYVGSDDGHLYALTSVEGDRTSSGGEYTMFRADRQNTGAVDAEIGDAVEEKWRFQTGDRVKRPPVVHDGTVYFGSMDGIFYAIGEERGNVEWRFDSLNESIGGPPSIHDDTVYFASGPDFGEQGPGAIHAVDCDSGEEQWVIDRDHRIQSPPAIGDGVVYYGGYDHKYHAVDAETGDDIWTFEAEGGFCNSKAGIKDGVLYIGSLNNLLYALDAATGEPLWRFETGNTVVTSPVVTDDGVYFGSIDDELLSADPETGEEQWRFEPDGAVYASPAYRDGLLFLGAKAHDASDDVSDDAAYGDGGIYAVNAETGEEVWHYPTEGGVYFSSPVVTEDTVYVGSRDQRLYAIRNKVTEQ